MKSCLDQCEGAAILDRRDRPAAAKQGCVTYRRQASSHAAELGSLTPDVFREHVLGVFSDT